MAQPFIAGGFLLGRGPALGMGTPAGKLTREPAGTF